MSHLLKIMTLHSGQNIDEKATVSGLSLGRNSMEQHALKNVNNCLYTKVYCYLEKSGGISYNRYLNIVHFFNTRVN